MRFAAFLLLSLSFPSFAETTHGGAGDTVIPPGSAMPADMPPLQLPQNTRGKPHSPPPAPPTSKEGEKAAPPGGGKRTHLLFIVASGPGFEAVHDELCSTIPVKIPGARVVSLKSFMEQPLLDAFKSEQSASSVLFILNTEGKLSRTGELELTMARGKITASKLADVLKQGNRLLGGPRVDTVLLTSHAGAITCNQFPGPLFGMSPSEGSRNEDALKLWMEQNSSFPTTAREWFDSWAITYKLTAKKYFLCPHAAGAKDHLGYKTSSDPKPVDLKHDGVYLDPE